MLTKENLKNLPIQSYLDFIYDKVRNAAIGGRFAVYYSFEEMIDRGLPYLTSEIRTAILNELRREDYTVRRTIAVVYQFEYIVS